MAINASVDGVTYNGITKVTAGGKTINLSYHDDGGGDLPAGIAEIKMGTFKPESGVYSDYNVAHGCGGAPDIIVLYSDYKTAYTSSSTARNTIVVGETWVNKNHKACAMIGSGYAGSMNAGTVTGSNIGTASDGAINSVDDTYFTIAAKSNRRLDTPVTYTWIAIRLA